MPRLVPKRARRPEADSSELQEDVADPEDWKPAPPLPPIVPSVRVRTSFTCEGHVFREGTYYAVANPLIQEILRDYPHLLEPAALPERR